MECAVKMNKQELASRIWKIANDLRGSMEASEYKDYILGFIFYKYLSDNEYQFLVNEGYETGDIAEISEENTEEVNYIRESLGYFIAPKNLYQEWAKLDSSFTVDNVITALSAFQRNISANPHHQKVFSGIFNTLETGISKLGSNANQRTKQVRSLVDLIRDIPTTNDEYDVLGYIYEYLIGKFAAGAGKSSGEYYSPHEVSDIMAQVTAHHLRNCETIEVYDPTSGSGSLLLNIGKSFEKHQDTTDNVKYYAQEYVNSTEILTRMNLVMRGIKPSNIVTRNGDSLEDDFPYFDESDPEGTYTPVFVDAVVSNPPYSKKWDPKNKDHDPRFSGYGLAPQSKADYAFLLHGLYHVKSDGIMSIILPHGVLFRGGDEGTIRQKLIDKNNIDTIIGLPANIFFGTGIPTIIMFLKKERNNSDILFIDASRGFVKDGSKNKLRPSDIKRISDTIINRTEIEKYSRLVSKDEVVENDYNLNIPRYVDSSDEAEQWDVLATMNGGIPKVELNKFDAIFEILPELHDELFLDVSDKYVELKTNDIHELFKNSPSVVMFKENYKAAFNGFNDYLKELLITNVESVHPSFTKDKVISALFDRYENIPLVDKYLAYGILNDTWTEIANDIEIIKTDGLHTAARAVDPNLVVKKKDGVETEVPDGEKGRIFPFELIQATLLKSEKEKLTILENRQIEIQEKLTNLIETLNEDEGEYEVLNETNDKFVAKATQDALSEQFETLETSEMATLVGFLTISGKNNQMAYMAENPEIKWSEMPLKKDGTPSNKEVNNCLKVLQASYSFEEETFGYKLSQAMQLMNEEKNVKKEIKFQTNALAELTAKTIKNLTDEQVDELLYEKWLKPLKNSIPGLVDKLFKEFEVKLISLHDKYGTTMMEIQKDIQTSNKELVAMMSQLTGSKEDMEGIHQFQAMLGGGMDE